MDDFRLHEALQRIRHWLPAQGPIKDFVHHNTLHAFQHLPFRDGLRAAARLYGAREFMPAEFYLDGYKSGLITESALDHALASAFHDQVARAEAKERLLAGPLPEPIFKSLAAGGLRSRWNSRLNGVSLDRLSLPPLFRLIGGYMDQGLSMWRMPGADQLDFFEAVVSLVQKSFLPLRPLHTAFAKDLLNRPPEEAALASLKFLVGREDLFERYVLELLLAQPGWSGLVAQCELQPGALLSPRKIRLDDYAAVALVIEAAALDRALGGKFQPLSDFADPEALKPLEPGDAPEWTGVERLLAVWQDAFDWAYYESLFGGVAAAAKRTKTAEPAPTQPSHAWAFFCIDDRECSFRRHIEEGDPLIETFATAGFFGLDFMYRGAGDTVAGKHCPVPMTPKHLVIEEVDEVPQRPDPKAHPLEPGANTFFRGWILSHALGFGAAVRLAANVFKPSLAPVSVPPLSTVTHKAKLRLARKDDTQMHEGLWIGYSVIELADRVQRLLESAGVSGPWPELAVFFGHGSSSVNNPYFAAYNCGACSGRPGAPNARAFAEAANMPEVRRLLRARGLDIPAGTWFVGALHDTSMDEVTYYDEDRLPANLKGPFQAFKNSVASALERNAAERCRRFEVVPDDLSPAAALREVRARAVSLFEPRPEYNHATNAALIIGRRSLTEGIFLDRRAFLSSYDPLKDPDGRILAEVLGAVIPVCGGINLEYYFSRIDPVVYGAGTKLSQNVSGLIGMINGIEGDLLTGLPTQMTEIHDPVRLLTLVEHAPQTALAAARANPKIFEWIHNEWIRFSCIDPATLEIWIYIEGQMQKVEGVKSPDSWWNDSLQAAHAGRRNLPMGFIRAKEGPG